KTVDTWRDAIVDSFQQAFGQIIALAPNVLGMVCVLIIGYFVARILDRATSALSESLGLQAAAVRSGLVASMKQVGIQRTLPWVVGKIVFWLTMCVFLTAAF